MARMQWFTALEDAKKSGFFLNKDEGPSQQVQNFKKQQTLLCVSITCSGQFSLYIVYHHY